MQETCVVRVRQRTITFKLSAVAQEEARASNKRGRLMGTATLNSWQCAALMFVMIFVKVAVIATPLQGQEVSISRPSGKAPAIEFEADASRAIPARLMLEQSFQKGPNCGVNALYLFLRLLDKDVTYETVKQQFESVPDQGLSLDALVQAAMHFDVPAIVRGDVSPEALARHLPAIVHLKSSGISGAARSIDHFIVLVAIDENGQYEGFDTTKLTPITYSSGLLARNMSGYVMFGPPRRTLWWTWVGLSIILVVSIEGTRRWFRK